MENGSCEHSFDMVTDECARCGMKAPLDEATVFRIIPTDGGKFLIGERVLGSRTMAFVARCESRAEAAEWIAGATNSDYRSSGLIFPTLREDAFFERPCVHCGAPCKFLLCGKCHTQATSDGFEDDSPTICAPMYYTCQRTGMRVSVDVREA